MTPSLQTLFLPLEQGSLTVRQPVLFIGAAWHPFLGELGTVDVWQPFKPLARQLENHGLSNLEVLPSGKAYNLVLVHLPKQVDEARYWLAYALKNLTADGEILVAAANDAGGGRIAGWLKEAGLETESLSKNKSRVVWGKSPSHPSPILNEWLSKGDKQSVIKGDGIEYMSQPGIFGWDKIDVGSKLLADHLPSSLKGVGADFGCGYGYLCHRLLQNNTAITNLFAIDADRRSVECCYINMGTASNVTYVWEDLSAPVAALPVLDFVLMNPPFHTGKKTDTSLGLSFIKTAAHHLKKGGTLYMVANAHLPYEDLLQTLFKTVRTVVQKDGFKIIEAVK